MTSVSVRYTRQRGDATVEGSVRLLLPEDADWQREWSIAYAALKPTVDAAFVGTDRPVSESPEPESPDAPDATPEVSQSPATVIPGERVSYTACRVMFNPNHLPEEGKRREQVRMRIGNKEQIRVGTPPGYVNAKSTDPDMMKLLREYRKGDIVDIEGTFEEPWHKRTSDGTVTEWDLVVESISRA